MKVAKEIAWSEQKFTLKDLPEFPIIVRVTKGYHSTNSIETVSTGQIARIHCDISQRRVLALDSRNRIISIPENYAIKFELLDEKGKTIRRHLRDISSPQRLPLAVSFDKRKIWRFKIGDTFYTPQTMGALVLLSSHNERFLVANTIHEGQIDKKVNLIPNHIDLELTVATGIVGGTKADFTGLKNLYSRHLKSIPFKKIAGSLDILIREEKEVESWLPGGELKMLLHKVDGSIRRHNDRIRIKNHRHRGTDINDLVNGSAASDGANGVVKKKKTKKGKKGKNKGNDAASDITVSSTSTLKMAVNNVSDEMYHSAHEFVSMPSSPRSILRSRRVQTRGDPRAVTNDELSEDDSLVHAVRGAPKLSASVGDVHFLSGAASRRVGSPTGYSDTAVTSYRKKRSSSSAGSTKVYGTTFIDGGKAEVDYGAFGDLHRVPVFHSWMTLPGKKFKKASEANVNTVYSESRNARDAAGKYLVAKSDAAARHSTGQMYHSLPRHLSHGPHVSHLRLEEDEYIPLSFRGRNVNHIDLYGQADVFQEPPHIEIGGPYYYSDSNASIGRSSSTGMTIPLRSTANIHFGASSDEFSPDSGMSSDRRSESTVSSPEPGRAMYIGDAANIVFTAEGAQYANMTIPVGQLSPSAGNTTHMSLAPALAQSGPPLGADMALHVGTNPMYTNNRSMMQGGINQNMSSVAREEYTYTQSSMELHQSHVDAHTGPMSYSTGNLHIEINDNDKARQLLPVYGGNTVHFPAVAAHGTSVPPYDAIDTGYPVSAPPRIASSNIQYVREGQQGKDVSYQASVTISDRNLYPPSSSTSSIVAIPVAVTVANTAEYKPNAKEVLNHTEPQGRETNRPEIMENNEFQNARPAHARQVLNQKEPQAVSERTQPVNNVQLSVPTAQGKPSTPHTQQMYNGQVPVSETAYAQHSRSPAQSAKQNGQPIRVTVAESNDEFQVPVAHSAHKRNGPSATTQEHLTVVTDSERQFNAHRYRSGSPDTHEHNPVQEEDVTMVPNEKQYRAQPRMSRINGEVSDSSLSDVSGEPEEDEDELPVAPSRRRHMEKRIHKISRTAKPQAEEGIVVANYRRASNKDSWAERPVAQPSGPRRTTRPQTEMDNNVANYRHDSDMDSWAELPVTHTGGQNLIRQHGYQQRSQRKPQEHRSILDEDYSDGVTSRSYQEREHVHNTTSNVTDDIYYLTGRDKGVVTESQMRRGISGGRQQRIRKTSGGGWKVVDGSTFDIQSRKQLAASSGPGGNSFSYQPQIRYPYIYDGAVSGLYAREAGSSSSPSPPQRYRSLDEEAEEEDEAFSVEQLSPRSTTTWDSKPSENQGQTILSVPIATESVISTHSSLSSSVSSSDTEVESVKEVQIQKESVEVENTKQQHSKPKLSSSAALQVDINAANETQVNFTSNETAMNKVEVTQEDSHAASSSGSMRLKIAPHELSPGTKQNFSTLIADIKSEAMNELDRMGGTRVQENDYPATPPPPPLPPKNPLVLEDIRNMSLSSSVQKREPVSRSSSASSSAMQEAMQDELKAKLTQRRQKEDTAPSGAGSSVVKVSSTSYTANTNGWGSPGYRDIDEFKLDDWKTTSTTSTNNAQEKSAGVTSLRQIYSSGNTPPSSMRNKPLATATAAPSQTKIITHVPSFNDSTGFTENVVSEKVDVQMKERKLIKDMYDTGRRSSASSKVSDVSAGREKSISPDRSSLTSSASSLSSPAVQEEEVRAMPKYTMKSSPVARDTSLKVGVARGGVRTEETISVTTGSVAHSARMTSTTPVHQNVRKTQATSSVKVATSPKSTKARPAPQAPSGGVHQTTPAQTTKSITVPAWETTMSSSPDINTEVFALKTSEQLPGYSKKYFKAVTPAINGSTSGGRAATSSTPAKQTYESTSYTTTKTGPLNNDKFDIVAERTVTTEKTISSGTSSGFSGAGLHIDIPGPGPSHSSPGTSSPGQYSSNASLTKSPKSPQGASVAEKASFFEAGEKDGTGFIMRSSITGRSLLLGGKRKGTREIFDTSYPFDNTGTTQSLDTSNVSVGPTGRETRGNVVANQEVVTSSYGNPPPPLPPDDSLRDLDEYLLTQLDDSRSVSSIGSAGHQNDVPLEVYDMGEVTRF